jgi:hypothetical protein
MYFSGIKFNTFYYISVTNKEIKHKTLIFNKMQTRKRTIQQGERKNKFTRSKFPQFMISGGWLQKAGFNPGDVVKIEVKNNSLIISK